MGRRPSFSLSGDSAAAPIAACGTIGAWRSPGSGIRASGCRVARASSSPTRIGAIAGPTGRGLTADICTYSHAEERASPGTPRQGTVPLSTTVLGVSARPASRPPSRIDSPGEYEVHEVLVTGVRTFRDDAGAASAGTTPSFVYELDGLDAIHLGDIGHVLTEQMLGEIGSVQIALRPHRRRPVRRHAPRSS